MTRCDFPQKNKFSLRKGYTDPIVSQITTRPRLLRFISTGALRLAICATAVLVGAAPCIAQQSAALADYPVKAIRIIVASSPGTASDFFARSLGGVLGAFYGKRA